MEDGTWDMVDLKSFLYRQLIICTICLYSLCTMAQRHDQNWVLGYGDYSLERQMNGAPVNFGQMLFSFFPDGKMEHKALRLRSGVNLGFTTSSYSNQDGALFCYSDGFQIFNSAHQVMEGGEVLNDGGPKEVYRYGFYPCSGSVLFLPSPVDPNEIYVIHIVLEYIGRTIYNTSFSYSLIDAVQNNGLGKVIVKNKLVHKDRYTSVPIAACRHGNGRDWWILAERGGYSNVFLIFLLDPSGLHLYHEQAIGPKINRELYSSNSDAVFSPDGSMFVKGHYKYGIQLFDFDRCTGRLRVRSELPLAPWRNIVGLEFSPSSRFLYVNTDSLVVQFDLKYKDLRYGGDTVATLDQNLDLHLPNRRAWMAWSQLAADGKIYISCIGSSPLFHTINKPDLKGKACDVQWRSVNLGIYNYAGLPPMPNYRLGSDPSCGLVNSAKSEPDIEFEIGPNPFTRYLTISLSKGRMHRDARFVLYDVLGRKVVESILPCLLERWQINMLDLVPGLYYYELSHGNILMQGGKLMAI